MPEWLNGRSLALALVALVLIALVALSLRPVPPGTEPVVPPTALQPQVAPTQGAAVPRPTAAQAVTSTQPSTPRPWRLICLAPTCNTESRVSPPLIRLSEENLQQSLRSGVVGFRSSGSEHVCVDVGTIIHLSSESSPLELRGLARVHHTLWSDDLQSVDLRADILWQSEAPSPLLSPTCAKPCSGTRTRQAALQDHAAYTILVGNDEVYQRLKTNRVVVNSGFTVPQDRLPKDKTVPIFVYTTSVGRSTEEGLRSLFEGLSRAGHEKIFWVYPQLDPSRPGGILLSHPTPALTLDRKAMAAILRSSSNLQWLMADAGLNSRGLKGRVVAIDRGLVWPDAKGSRIEPSFFQFFSQHRNEAAFKSLQLDRDRPVVIVGADPTDPRVEFISAWLIFHGHSQLMVFPDGASTLQAILSQKSG